MSQQMTTDPTMAETPLRKPPALKHFVCPCQLVLGDQGHAYCGQRVAGRAMNGANIPPMDLCVLCGDFKTDERPCPACGRPCDPWRTQ